jgi:DNA repair protein RecO (recombination protein O)
MNFSDQAYVIHSRPYRETSLLVNLFCRQAGRFTVVSKGLKNKKNNPLQPFSLLQVSCSGRGELKNLLGAEPIEHRILRGNKLFMALYLNELLMRLVHEHEPQEAIFDYYTLTLLKLVSETDVEPCLRQFEFHLLQELGYGVCVDTDCCSGEEVDARSVYSFDPAEGVKLAMGVAASTTFSGASLLAIGRGDFSDPEVRVAAKRLARLALAPHLGSKPLMSREFFRGIGSNIPAVGEAGKAINGFTREQPASGGKISS